MASHFSLSRPVVRVKLLLSVYSVPRLNTLRVTQYVHPHPYIQVAYRYNPQGGRIASVEDEINVPIALSAFRDKKRIKLVSATNVFTYPCHGCPDMTFAVDWALNNNYLSIYPRHVLKQPHSVFQVG